ncbi:MAG TPA: phosphoribosylglycinamide formyltransferase [Bacteroidales bacterium]|nr:phosphoribosylglycinamide formyltransferase [Bacteroidales bacterium]HRR92909.1 phosphoribosylglycinamide formyltransferase [Bacteroidales bacterium]HRT89015.1 phosphoribosylglycinamide formyltransferase [Bacteroidales bacterium]
MSNIAIFASGSGTNAENIINYFSNRKTAKVAVVLSNNPEAYVIKRSEKLKVPAIIFDRHDFYQTENVLGILEDYDINYIVLAGFLWLVPGNILQKYRNRIINIHPALLPDFGGKGMYGERVHRAVIKSGVRESGITIHHVDEVYDNGRVIFQARCPVSDNDTPETLAAKIHELEYRYYPVVIEKLITGEAG